MTSSSYPELLCLTAPEIALALAALLILALDITLLRRSSLAIRFRTAAITASAGCLAAFLLLLVLPGQGSLPAGLPSGLLVANPLTQIVQEALVVFAALIFLLVVSARFTEHVGEYCAVILFATIAAMILVGTQNLLVIFLAIEFLSLSLYILTAFDKNNARSAQAGLKYFLFGGMSAGILLFGMSLLYGISGSIALKPIAAAVSRAPGDPLLTLAIVMVLAGFGFKIAAAPFHLWAPEVYQGAPTWSAAVVASTSKIAGFFAMAVLFYVGLMAAAGSADWKAGSGGWTLLIAVVAAASAVWGNLAAVAQTSVRRLLAYSAIGHAGYALIALAAHTEPSLAALVYYVITYALAVLGAFAVLVALETEGVDRVTEFAGLARRAPGLSLCLAVFLLSLAGIPPLAGFFGKFYVFVAALDAGRFGLLWLVLLALVTTVISLYYYLKVLKQAYVAEPPADAGALAVPAATRFAIWVMAALVIVLGCWPDLLLNRITAAAAIALR